MHSESSKLRTMKFHSVLYSLNDLLFKFKVCVPSQINIIETTVSFLKRENVNKFNYTSLYTR